MGLDNPLNNAKIETMNVTCMMLTGLEKLAIYRGNTLIGYVWDGKEEEPTITLMHDLTHSVKDPSILNLTFTDSAIIWDNWRIMMEIRQDMLKETPRKKVEGKRMDWCEPWA